MEQFTRKLIEALRNDTGETKVDGAPLGLTLNEYQKLSARTANTHDYEEVNYALGLTGEAGEVADLIKKGEFHGHGVDKVELRKELGDVLWYLSQLARVGGLTLEEVAKGNVDKLAARYPEGFSQEASRNREEDE